MTPPRQESLIHGYRVPILQGVWQRVTTFGVLRLWSHAWAAACLFVGLLTLTYVGLKWVVVPVGLWLLGHGTLLLLTQWNSKFDEMFFAHLRRRYKSSYRAG